MNLPHQNDDDFAEKDAALVAIWFEAKPWLRNVVRETLWSSTQSDVEDVLNDVFITLTERGHEIRGTTVSEVMGWLKTVARNSAINRNRNWDSRKRSETKYAKHHPDQVENLADILDRRLSEDEIALAIETCLSGDERTALRLRTTDPPSKYEEIAQILNKSVSAAHCLVRRAGIKVLKRLRIAIPDDTNE